MPKIITIHGPMAVGKSTITTQLREKLPKYAYVDRPYIKRGLKPLGRELALKLSKEASYYLTRKIMRLGKNIILEEISPVSLRRKIKHSIFKKYNYQIYSFYLICSVNEAKRREKLRRNQKTPRPRLLERIHKEFPPPSKHEIVIDTEKLSANQAVKFILKKIGK